MWYLGNGRGTEIWFSSRLNEVFWGMAKCGDKHWNRVQEIFSSSLLNTWTMSFVKDVCPKSDPWSLYPIYDLRASHVPKSSSTFYTTVKANIHGHSLCLSPLLSDILLPISAQCTFWITLKSSLSFLSSSWPRLPSYLLLLALEMHLSYCKN